MSKKTIPFAKDIDGQLLCVRANPTNAKEYTVVVCDVADSCEINEDTNQTLGEYLEHIRDSLLLKKLFYEEELGLASVQ